MLACQSGLNKVGGQLCDTEITNTIVVQSN